jgi:hypothetical protein
MVARFGWKETFALVGSLGVIWSLVWWSMFKDSPARHPRVNQAELAHIQEGQSQKSLDDTAMPMKWYELFKHRNIWAMCIGFFMINYNSYFFITWLLGRGGGQPQVGINDFDVALVPSQLHGARAQGVSQTQALLIGQHLMRAGLTDINDRLARQMASGDKFVAHAESPERR